MLVMERASTKKSSYVSWSLSIEHNIELEAFKCFIELFDLVKGTRFQDLIRSYKLLRWFNKNQSDLWSYISFHQSRYSEDPRRQSGSSPTEPRPDRLWLFSFQWSCHLRSPITHRRVDGDGVHAELPAVVPGALPVPLGVAADSFPGEMVVLVKPCLVDNSWQWYCWELSGHCPVLRG